MNEQKISFNTAKLASEKGFIDGSKYYYFESVYGKDVQLRDYGLVYNKEDGQFEDVYEAPTQSILQKWLRDEHKIFINMKHIVFNQKFGYSITGKYQNGDYGVLKSYDWTKFESYEECLENALVEALNFI